LQITKSIRKSIASFVELTLPYIIASSPVSVFYPEIFHRINSPPVHVKINGI